jgi:3-deoxy-D-manno-octulosonic-acid transferase
VNRFLSRIDCPQLWLVETEFWANLILSAHNKGIQLRLINARITHKTLHSPAWWRRLLVHLLDTHITQIFCRHAQDVQDFRTLGVTGSHIHAIGNLKWCDDQTPAAQRLLGNLYVVFASTHEPEELELARRWQQHPQLPQLVIVPRHPKRGTAIMKQFASAGIEAVQRSQSTTQDSKSIMLADTFGELISWMAYSELVIMGGSFAPKGGQNPLEAIRLGKCVLCGSDMRDFAEEVQALTPTGAIMSVDNMDHLIDAVIQQLQHPQILHEHGMEGKSWLIEHSRDILRHYL